MLRINFRAVQEDDVLAIYEILPADNVATSPEANVIRNEIKDAIVTILSTLSLDNRRFVDMLYLAYSQDKIA